MATAYTSLLGLALPITGELSGTWGSTVNTEITALLDSAIAGTTTLSTDADVTLTTTTGAANTSRQAILLCSGARTVLRTITAPAQSKIYTIINATTGGFSVKLVGAGPTTGVTVVAGESAVCAWNGSDFIKISNTAGVGTFTNLTVTGTLGVTGVATLGNGAILGTPASGTVTNLTGTASININGTVGATTASTGAFTSITASTTLGVTGVSTLTAGAVVQGLTVGRGAGAVATNTAVGASALAANTSGTDNTAVGSGALDVNTSGAYNTALGRNALGANTTGAGNMASGFGALGANVGGSSNTAVGEALGANISGNFNSAVGSGALAANTASFNTAVGYQAGYSTTTGANNTAVGYQAAYSNTTGATNVVYGYQSFKNNTSGNYNTALGYQALQANTTAENNTAVGFTSLTANTTGQFNVALGAYSLAANTTASNNTAVGYQAGYSNTTGIRNTSLGFQAGYALTTTNASTIIGAYAGLGTTGESNTFLGDGAGELVTSGAKNSIFGRFNGNQGGLDIRTASNRVVLSDGDGNVRYFHDGSATGIVYPNISASPTFFYAWDTARFYPNPDNSLNLGLGSNRFNTVFASNGTINTSDKNEKQDIQELSALELVVAQEIKGLFKTYRWKSAVAEKGDAARIHVGVIAQDVQEAFAKHGLDAARYALWCSDTWYEVDGKASLTAAEPFTAETPNAVLKTRLGIRYDQLLAFVIAAM